MKTKKEIKKLNLKAMKTISTYILSVIFILSGIFSFAMTPEFPVKKSELKKEILFKINFSQSIPVVAEFEDMIVSEIDLSLILPFTPEEAVFEEMLTPKADYSALAPEIPAYASFEDSDPYSELSAETVKSLAPTTPKEAAFDDEASDLSATTSLAPVTPQEATFEE